MHISYNCEHELKLHSDYFLTADHKEQLRLVSFLTQLQTHFPHWQSKLLCHL